MDTENIEKSYPTAATLKNQQTLHIRLMTDNDVENLFKFFSILSASDKLYLKEDVQKIAAIKAWMHRIDTKRAVTLLAEIDGTLCAEATLHQQSTGWSKHVGNIRINVSPDYRGLGIATILCEKICWAARNVNIEKLIAEVILEQQTDLAIFQNFGFKQEAVLKDQVLDIHGKKHDLIILTNYTGKILKEIHSHMLYTDPRFGNEY